MPKGSEGHPHQETEAEDDSRAGAPAQLLEPADQTGELLHIGRRLAAGQEEEELDLPHRLAVQPLEDAPDLGCLQALVQELPLPLAHSLDPQGEASLARSDFTGEE